jgi:hypothetical protein
MFSKTLSEAATRPQFNLRTAIKVLTAKLALFFQIAFSPQSRGSDRPSSAPTRQSKHLTENWHCFFKFTSRQNSASPNPAHPSVKLEKAALAPAWPRRLPYRE